MHALLTNNNYRFGLQTLSAYSKSSESYNFEKFHYYYINQIKPNHQFIVPSFGCSVQDLNNGLWLVTLPQKETMVQGSGTSLCSQKEGI
jgi:hypothetical protein